MTSILSTSLVPMTGTSANTYLFRRPLSVPWSSLNIDFSPSNAQDIGIREKYQVTIALVGENSQIYANMNRFKPMQNIGNWQILYKDEDLEYYVEREGQAECPTGYPDQNSWKFTLGYDWTYRLFRSKDDFFGAFLSVVDNCNADLEPGVVPNGFVNRENILQFVKIAAKFYGGSPAQAIDDLLDLLGETTTGYRLPDKNLFTVKSQLPVVDLSEYVVKTAIGDLGLWVHPFFEPTECIHTIEVRHYGKVPKLANQLVAPACRYPGTLTLGSPDCEGKFSRFISSTQNVFSTYDIALAYFRSQTDESSGSIYDPADYIFKRVFSTAGCPDKDYWFITFEV